MGGKIGRNWKEFWEEKLYLEYILLKKKIIFSIWRERERECLRWGVVFNLWFLVNGEV